MNKEDFDKKMNNLVNILENSGDLNYCDCGPSWSPLAKGALFCLCVQLDGFTDDIMSSIPEEEITIEIVREMSTERALVLAQESTAFEQIVIDHDRGSLPDGDDARGR